MTVPAKRTIRRCERQISISEWLRQAHLQVERAGEGLNIVAEALGLTETNFDRLWETELYRLKGELLLVQVEGFCPTPRNGTFQKCASKVTGGEEL